MRHHRIYVQDKPCMQNPTVITLPEEEVTAPLFMPVTIVCTYTSSPTRLSSDSLDIPTWLGSSLCSLSKRLTKWGGGRFIYRYCGNSRWRIAEQIPQDWNRARATQHHTRPLLHYDKNSVTGENCWRQSSICNKHHGSWRWCFWKLAPICTLSQYLHVKRETLICQTIWP